MYYETSAKDGQNVELAFLEAGENLPSYLLLSFSSTRIVMKSASINYQRF